MKKVIAILLTFCLLLSVTACGGATTSAGKDAEPASEAGAEAVQEDAPEAGAEAVQEAAPEAGAEAVQEAAPEAGAEAVQEAAPEAAEEADQAVTTETAQAASTEAASEAATEAASEAATETAAEAETAVGSYKLTNIISGAGSNLEFVSTAISLGANFYLVLTEDNTGYMDFLEANIPLDWDDSSIKIHSEDNNSESLVVPYTCSGDSLQISTQAYSIEFTRMTDEDLEDYKKNGSGSLNGMIGTIIEGLLNNMDGDLLSVLLSGFGQGLTGISREPIPEGEPSTEQASVVIDNLKFDILGTDHVKGEEGDLIVFYYDVTNSSDLFRHAWNYDCDASQGGSFLEDVYEGDLIPELINDIYEIAPGRTIRCASAYSFDPDGGVVSFRISTSEDDNTLLYYVDPANLSGAPEPFAFDADPSIPEYLEALPEETEEFRIDRTEFFTDEEGNNALRIYFYFRNTSEQTMQMSDGFASMAIQDGVELNSLWEDDVEGGANHMVDVAPGEEILISRSYTLRTGSPTAFVVFIYEDDYTVINPILSKTIEIQ